MGFTTAAAQAEKFKKIQLDNQAIKDGEKVGEPTTPTTGTTPSGSPEGKTGNHWITAAEFIANDGVVNGVKYPTHGDYLRATGFYTPLVPIEEQIAKWEAGQKEKEKRPSGALDYGEIDGKEEEKGPSGALGYGEWLEQSGNDTQAAYERAVAAARRQYAMNRASFGLKGEQLGRAGLTGSGYGDYLEGKAYASMVGAEAAAEAQRAEGDRQNAIGYASYLTAKDNEAYQKRVGLYDALVKTGSTDTDVLKKVAKLYGNDMSEKEIEEIVGLAQGTMKSSPSTHTAKTLEDQVYWGNRLLSAYTSVGDNGLNTVTQEMKTAGYDDDFIQALWNSVKSQAGEVKEIPYEYIEQLQNVYSEDQIDMIAQTMIHNGYDQSMVDYLVVMAKHLLNGESETDQVNTDVEE